MFAKNQQQTAQAHLTQQIIHVLTVLKILHALNVTTL